MQQPEQNDINDGSSQLVHADHNRINADVSPTTTISPVLSTSLFAPRIENNPVVKIKNSSGTIVENNKFGVETAPFSCVIL